MLLQAAQSDADKVAAKLKETEAKAEMYGKELNATADKANVLERAAADFEKKASVRFLSLCAAQNADCC